jgi:hypothetical protein
LPLKQEEELRLKHHAVASAEDAASAAERRWPRLRLTREWAALLFAVVSFVCAQIMVVTLHLRSTRLDHQTQEIQLTRDLAQEFFQPDKPYLKIAGAIESCQKVYKGYGGSFTHVDINNYLGFFSDLGLFMQRGVLSEDLIGHYFGAFIIEAYEYPEIKKYIQDIRKNFNQPQAFEDFQAVASAVEEDPRFVSLTELARTMCAPQADTNQ